jgi:hypothetical protein
VSAAVKKKKIKRGANTPWGADGMLYGNDCMRVEPTRWELLLAELGVRESEALAIAARRMDGPRPQMLRFAQVFRGRFFVPEPVLDALGLSMHDSAVRRDVGRYRTLIGAERNTG